ncbi:2OG-Fe(II) oxygenase [Caldimonas tepidiphila]|uniref:2OG-Fe(II) oxygenase n=1 Tax=Caldimonas tepidiphila TaxID=2315841 RepID=UPI000E5B4B7C|nr:2OG-Fe(II) oxygenase [Caldimonas tepidiphila]
MHKRSDHLCEADLRQLAEGRLQALQIGGFLPRETATELARKLLADGYSHYINAPSIGRIGNAFYEAENRPERLERYFAEAIANIERIRRACLPYPCPIDLVRCKLDETWPAGALLASLHGRKMFVGLSRVVEPGVYFLPHHDYLEKDAPGSFEARSLRAQLACNVYLDMPGRGGEIELWMEEIPPADFDRLRGDSYGIAPDTLGAPDLVIEPAPGDLILFNSRKIHAVRAGSDRPRVSLSCFVGYRGPHMPLSCWS